MNTRGLKFELYSGIGDDRLAVFQPGGYARPPLRDYTFTGEGGEYDPQEPCRVSVTDGGWKAIPG